MYELNGKNEEGKTEIQDQQPLREKIGTTRLS